MLPLGISNRFRGSFDANVPFQALVPMFPVLDFMADYTAESLWPTGCLFFLMKRTVNLRVPVVPGQKIILHQISIEILRISTFLMEIVC